MKSTIIKPFEKLTANELYDILKLRNEVFVVEQQCIYQDCDDKDKISYHIFIKDNEKIVAYLRVFKKSTSQNEISIGRVVVNPKYRGKGLAKKIMNEAIKFTVDKLKIKDIRISAQAYLIDFYKDFGFTVISEEYLEDGIPHVEMLYSLK